MKRLLGSALPPRLEPHARDLVRSVYLNLLRREPDAKGMDDWLAFLLQGGSFDKLLGSFLASHEYSELRPSMPPVPVDEGREKEIVRLREAYDRGYRWAGSQNAEVPEAPAAPAVPDNPLARYFDAHHEGPGIWKWWHYLDLYHRHFARFIGQEVHLLEIGVFGGGSLSMWCEYFGPGCQIHGVDFLEACRKHEREGVKIYIGDQSDRDFWRRMRQEVPRVDIVIDDGGHQFEQQVVSLEELLPHVQPGGIYSCEDVYGHANPFHDYVAGLTRHLNALGEPVPGAKSFHEGFHPNALQRSVQSVHHYPFVTIFEKHAAPVEQLAAPQRGTEWAFAELQAHLKARKAAREAAKKK